MEEDRYYYVLHPLRCLGKGLYDHDQPIQTPRRTFVMYKDRSTGVAWPSTGGSWRHSGFLVNAHSTAPKRTTDPVQFQASAERGQRILCSMFDNKLAPPMTSSSTGVWPNFRVTMSFPTRRRRQALPRNSKPATEGWAKGQVLK
jgi:hypothetical protein